MDQNEARIGQEARPETNQIIQKRSQEQIGERPTSMESLLEQEGLGLDFPKQGEVRTGVIASIGENEVLVSVGTKSEGVISARELDQLSDEERVEFAVGAEIPVYVVNPEDPNGNVRLSYLRALEERDWKRAEQLLESGEAYQGNIIGFNKGGLLVPMGRLRGFVPGSQVSVIRRLESTGNTPEQRWGEMIDEPITVSVIEVDRERRRLILSERAALQETRETLKERLLDELEEGDVRTGRVTSLADFGAFVNIEGADGLVHLSELSWEHVDHPKEVLKVGQEVKVKVINVDYDRKRIGLSIRQLQPDPWLKRIENIKEGQLVEGTITHLTKFGAFARLDEDLEGLIHISELSEQRVAHPKEVVHEGDVVTLRVIKIDPERHRIGLSLRKVDSPKYTDFDWKTTLAEVVEETHDEEVEEPEVVEAEKGAAIPEEETPASEPVPESGGEAESGEVEVSEEPEVPLEVTEEEVEVIEAEPEPAPVEQITDEVEPEVQLESQAGPEKQNQE
ncbi:MAG: S1 RNA-binding domain-containing protein [Anaerolineales bacterium]|jgi:small subunit ribosomal protein S1